MQANCLIQLIFFQPNHSHLLPGSVFQPHARKKRSLSLPKLCERYFLQKYSDQMQIAKSHQGGDSRLVVSLAFLDRYISPMIEISDKIRSALCFGRNSMGCFESEKNQTHHVIVSTSTDPDEIWHYISQWIQPQTLLDTVTLAMYSLTQGIITFSKAEDKTHWILPCQREDSKILQRYHNFICYHDFLYNYIWFDLVVDFI